jgi:hypothetical protein
MTASPGPGALQQALSEQHKDRVKTWVPKVRRLLEEDFGRELNRLGLRPDGKHKPIETMSLPVEDVHTRGRLEALLRRETLAEGTSQRGYATVQHELAYTLLNRLVGLKAMETRGLLYLPPPGDPEGAPEPTEVLTPIPGQTLSRYVRDVRAAGGSRYKYSEDADEALLRDSLTAVFRFITQEIRVLFDPEHEYACLWPPHPKLVEVIRSINEDVPAEAYRAQDFVGWVYQFFNREEKKHVRDQNKGTPRSSYELAVINQFYTPSWVVKVLIDNTLGRLWIQMHPDSALALEGLPSNPGGSTEPGSFADYIAHNWDEIKIHQQLHPTGAAAPAKKVREITLLDPACGTMHFGQYAFGLFHRMYLEELDNVGKPGWPEEASVANAQDIPAAIIENNLFGIDIDPRAIQIASLSLLLTAKEASLQQGSWPLAVQIRSTNLVVANAVNLGADRIRTLVEKVGKIVGADALREKLFTSIWNNLQYVGELGGLVQVKESVAQVLTDWIEARQRERGPLRAHKRLKEQSTFDFIEVLDHENGLKLLADRQALEDEAHQIESELFTALQGAAAEANDDPADRIFAEDTARGLKLLQILSRRYDVVVMNPPYGGFVPEVKPTIARAYPNSKNNIYAAFVDRATQLVQPTGYIGALTSSTFLTLIRDFEKFRRHLLLSRNPLILLLDLGFGVLDDATVETAAFVLAGDRETTPTVASFFDLRHLASDEREARFAISLAEPTGIRRDIPLAKFLDLDGCPLAYRWVDLLGPIFKRLQSFDPHFADARQGLISTESERFVRQKWEIAPRSPKTWVAYAKGGDFSRFYADLDLVFDWTRDGEDIKRIAAERYGSASRTVKCEEYYFRSGITWVEKTVKGMNARVLPKGAIFNVAGPSAFPKREEYLFCLLAILNSNIAQACLECYSTRSWGAEYVGRIPVPSLSSLDAEEVDELSAIAKNIHTIKAFWDEGNEISTCFQVPWLLRCDLVDADSSLAQRLDRLAAHETIEESQLQKFYNALNEGVYRLYGVSREEQELIEKTLGGRPPELLWPQMEGKSLQQRRVEHVFRLLSYIVKRVLEADEDGIVPFGRIGTEEGILDRLHHDISILFPSHESGQIEAEIVNELRRGAKGYRPAASIAEWLGNCFFDYHCALYKGRPIIWHVASKQGTVQYAFGALCHYHKFDRNRFAKLRAQHLLEAIDTFRREAALADKEGRAADRVAWHARLEEAQDLDRRLQQVQEGEGDFGIQTPWKTPAERPLGWDPDLDDGVKVNIEPLQKAGVLRIAKVIG